ncbi:MULTISPECIES: protein YgfX [Dyella]|nr:MULTISPECIES: protein YgfX [Dyella]MCP1374916.1 hypothetical protein [Dyella lutea]
MTSAPAIGFEYRPSRGLALGLIGMLALAMLSVALSGLPGWGKLVLASAAMALVLASRMRQTTPPASVGWSPDAGWLLLGRDGVETPAVLASHRMLAGCLVLELRVGERRQVLWLLPDNSDPDTRRRLRMRLAAGQGVPSPPAI